MGRTRALVVVIAGLALVTGCGSGGAESPSDTPAGSSGSSASASPSPTASASASASPSLTEAAPTGTLSTAPLKCKSLDLPAGLQQAGSSPDVMCAFESATDYVSFTVSRRQAPTFATAKVVEQASSKGKVVIEQVAAEGWTFGAKWPPNGALTRVQRWLVDAKGQVLLCKMGSDRGDAGIAELVAVCDQAKAKLHTP